MATETHYRQCSVCGRTVALPLRETTPVPPEAGYVCKNCDLLAQKATVIMQIAEKVSGRMMVETDYSPPPELKAGFDEVVNDKLLLRVSQPGWVMLTRQGALQARRLRKEASSEDGE